MYDAFGIENYHPAALSETGTILKAYQALKPYLQHKTLSSIWTVWPDDKDEPCECTPIVLQFGSYRHEVCWEKTDDLMLSANTIDTSKGFDLYNFEMPRHWKENALLDFQPFIGQKLLSVDLVEAAVNYSPNKGINQLWVSNAVVFKFERDTLQIYNTLDCTNITMGLSSGDEYRCVSVWERP